MNTLSRLAELETRFNGPIPDALLLIARLGTPEAVALLQAEASVEFYRRMVCGQLDIIRNRRVDGSFYPALLKDLRYYRHHYRAHRRHARELRRVIVSAIPQTIAA